MRVQSIDGRGLVTSHMGSKTLLKGAEGWVREAYLSRFGAKQQGYYRSYQPGCCFTSYQSLVVHRPSAMAASRTVLCSCVVLSVLAFSTVNTQTTQSLNGTQPSTSDGNSGDEMILEKSMNVLYDMVKGFLQTVQPKKITELKWLSKYSSLLRSVYQRCH